MLRTLIETDDDRRVNELLRQIITNPGEDTLRLVYADALEERGDGDDALWAATIRHAVKWNAENLYEASDWSKVSAFELECRRTINALAGSPLFSSGKNLYYPFKPWAYWRRGFVAEVRMLDLGEWREVEKYLYWHAGQTEKYLDWATGAEDPMYHGTGDIYTRRELERPRPCPATAQPVQCVKLARRPELRSWGRGQSRNGYCYFLGEGDPPGPDVEVQLGTPEDDVIRLCLDQHWPTVTFEFPGVVV